MLAQKESAVRTGENMTAPNKVIRIVSHARKKHKSRKNIIVKAITYSAAILALYGLLLLEFHFAAGLFIFGLTFTYLMLFAYANGGFK